MQGHLQVDDFLVEHFYIIKPRIVELVYIPKMYVTVNYLLHVSIRRVSIRVE